VCVCACLCVQCRGVVSVGKALSGVYVCVSMCVHGVVGRVFGGASSYVCLCVRIDVCVHLCRPVMLWK